MLCGRHTGWCDSMQNIWSYYQRNAPTSVVCGGSFKMYLVAGMLSLPFFSRQCHICTDKAKKKKKKSKGNWWEPFLFHHKELGHPLIIVNQAINLSVAQMNTALEMRQSLLACYVSLTQFILFTQDHSYVKLGEGVCLSGSHSHLLFLTERPLVHNWTHAHGPDTKVTWVNVRREYFS